MSLGAVYKATEVYMVQDKSEDFYQTWQFLDRRIEDITIVSKVARQVKTFIFQLREYPCNDIFLAPLAVGQQAYVMAHCASICQCVHASVHPCVNFFFKHVLL